MRNDHFLSGPFSKLTTIPTDTTNVSEKQYDRRTKILLTNWADGVQVIHVRQLCSLLTSICGVSDESVP